MSSNKLIQMIRYGRFQQILSALNVDHTSVAQYSDLELEAILKALFFTGQTELCWNVLHAAAINKDHSNVLTLFIGWKAYYDNRYHESGRYAKEILSNTEQGVSYLHADALHLKAMSLLRGGRPTYALRTINNCIALRRTLGDHFGLVFSLIALSTIELQSGSLEHSLRAANESLIVARRLQLPLRECIALSNSSIVQHKMGLYKKAIESSKNAISILLGQSPIPIKMARAHIMSARANLALYRVSEAKSSCQDALHYSSSFPREQALALETLGDIAVAQDEHDKAREYYRQALAIGERIAPEGDIVAEVHRRIASLHLKEGDLVGAVHLLRDAIARAKKCSERFEIGLARRDLSVAYLAQRNYKQAIDQARRSVELFRDMGSPIEQARSLVQLAEAALAWHHFLAGDADAAVRLEDDSPYSHLEYAWTRIIEAYHLFGELDNSDGMRRCEALMDRMRRESTPIWLSQHPLRRRSQERQEPAEAFIADSPAMRQAMTLVELAAATDEPVLLTGETGTGKEVLARLIHRRSARAERRFVAVNCAAIPETLFEREFFGHRKGAFTGADRDQPGYCEEADGGTLMLDEIGEMPLSLQVKLLRLLQEGTFRRLGEARERRVDLRIVAATNAPLSEMIAQGKFRRDLYYRLQTLEIALPPLRERAEDLEPLVRLFVRRELGGDADPAVLFDADVWEALRSYFWPGNVRELESTVRRLALLARHNGRVTATMLPGDLRRSLRLSRARAGRLDDYLEQVERERILAALAATGGRRSEAARELGISRSALYRRMQRLGIQVSA